MRNSGSIVRQVVKRLFAKRKQSNATKFMKLMICLNYS